MQCTERKHGWIRDLIAESIKTGRPLQQQGYTGEGWVDLENFRNIMSDPRYLRIKPAATKRLIRVDELPPVCWVRWASFDNSDLSPVNYDLGLITGRAGDFVYFGIDKDHRNSHSTQWLCEKGYEWSSNLKTWNSFEVDDNE